MNLVDVLFNGAGLLLWLSWRTVRFVRPAPAMTIYSVLREAKSGRSRRRLALVWLILLLGGRSMLYWRVGSRVDWVPTIGIGALSLPFNSISPGRMLAFSLASFGLVLAVFHMWLLLIDVINRHLPDSDLWQKLVRLQLGWMARLPPVFKVFGPAFIASGLWVAVNPWLVSAGMTARPLSAAHLWQQAFVVGAGACLAYKYLIVLILFLGVMHSYLYLGNYTFWTFVGATSRNLLSPLHRLPLRLGRVDLSPVLGIAVVWLFFTGCEQMLGYLFTRLPL